MVAVMVMSPKARSSPLPVHDAGHHVTEATVIVDASPSQVYALVTDYARWPELLSDVRSVTVERGTRDHARVRFGSKILGHDVTVQFDNEPDRAIRFVGVEGPPGGRASGTYLLEPIDGGRRTRVTASLYLEVVGMPSLFVGDAKVRTMREAKLRADLTDVLHRTATAAPAAG
jgi:ribosome-associated toxin RatA of RatAB toxin-antitoxin module